VGLAVTERGRLADAELAARAAGGDRDAFAELYERHFRGLYDFAARVLRDRELAGDVVQSTFAKAWESLLRSRRAPGHVKPWLYAIAHNCAIDELRRGKRLVVQAERQEGAGEGGGEVFAEPDTSRLADPVEVLRDRELAELVWSAAEALPLQDYALLDLHVRRGLSAEELAEELGIAKGALYTRLSRLRDGFEQAVAALVLARKGARECAELRELLASLGGGEHLTREASRAVRRHADGCARCGQTRRRLAVPASILAGLAPVPMLPGVERALWGEVERSLGPPRRGFPKAPGRVRKLVTVAAVTAAVAAGAASAVVLTRGGPVPPSDPDDVRSTSHEPGIASTNPVVRIAWSREPSAHAFSVVFSRAAQELPDVTADLPGSATSVASGALPPGTWWFHLRTQGAGGEWTSTVHLGPFVIAASVADPPEPQVPVEPYEPESPAGQPEEPEDGTKPGRTEPEQPASEPPPPSATPPPPAAHPPTGQPPAAEPPAPPPPEPPAPEPPPAVEPPPEEPPPEEPPPEEPPAEEPPAEPPPPPAPPGGGGGHGHP
jgi:RNA polymerase sigma factor (sigma-70 family)